MFHMGWFLNVSVHNWQRSAWDGRPGDEWMKPQLYIEMAQALERARFDYLMFEDSAQVQDTHGGNMDFTLTNAYGAPEHDPMTFLPVIASETESIGLIGTT